MDGGKWGMEGERKERRRGNRERERGREYIFLSPLFFLPPSFPSFLPFIWTMSITDEAEIPCPSPRFHFLFSLPRDNSCHAPACVDLALYCHYTPHAHTPHIVLLCAVRQTWSDSYCVEPDMLERSDLPLFITFPSSIYVAVVQGLASFLHQGPGGKYFGLWGSHQGSVSYSFL